MSQRVWVTTGFVLAFAAGYLVAAWQGGRMPWQTTSSRPPQAFNQPVNPSTASPSMPNLAPLFPPPEKTQPPPAGALPQIRGSDPASQGDLLFEQGRFGEAILQYRKALEANPKDADSWNDLGLALHYLGRGEEALEALRKGTTVDPLFQRVWLSLGFVAFLRQRPQEAKAAFDTVLAIDPSTVLAEEARKFLKQIP